MMRKSVMVMVLLAMVGAWAMPTSSELQKAQGLVNELMASDLAALRSGKKTPVEVADASMDYAAEAETEAGKFLFYRGAFDLYVKAKDYDKTADALEALRKAISDVDRDVLIGMLTRALKNVASENGGRLTALQRQLRVEAQAERQIKALRDQLEKTPNDAAVRERLAVALALLGDWKAALTEFAKVKGDVAKVADWELSYPNGGDAWTSAAAADFWWGYAEGAKLGDAAEQAFHSHAAAWYKVAINEGLLTGIKKTLAQKRIDEIGDSVEEPPFNPPTSTKKMYCIIDLSGGPSAKEYPVTYCDKPPEGGFNVDLYKTTKLVLRLVPQGKFMMGGVTVVTLTKPFYIVDHAKPFRRDVMMHNHAELVK